jgi:2-amino-4-hydroxy-6-hydroxymethyldihydropteridine diphosphokinase
MATALIAFGGNLGDVQANFNQACTALMGTCTIVAKSKLYKTPALTVEHSQPQPDYLNAAIKVDTLLSADDLLQELHRIEAKQGRERITHWGARTLDLDLLAYDTLTSNLPTLNLPHPQIQHRLFVLQPMADIQPAWVHPLTHKSITSMIQDLISQQQSLFEGFTWTNT